MKEISKEVKSGGKVVTVVKAPQADTWAEAQKIAGGEKEALAKFNAQVLTDAMNKARKPSGGGIGRLVSKAPPEAKDQIKKILEKYGIKIE
jgi:hypothetical protein